jgi:hypothetical protein
MIAARGLPCFALRIAIAVALPTRDIAIGTRKNATTGLLSAKSKIGFL